MISWLYIKAYTIKLLIQNCQVFLVSPLFLSANTSSSGKLLFFVGNDNFYFHYHAQWQASNSRHSIIISILWQLYHFEHIFLVLFYSSSTKDFDMAGW